MAKTAIEKRDTTGPAKAEVRGPALRSAYRADEVEVLAAARVVYATIGGHPFGEVGERLRGT